jgi:ribokinase
VRAPSSTPRPRSPDGRDLLALADVVVLNETELAHYARASSDALIEASLKTYADCAHMLGASTVIVTLGARGALVVDDREFVHHAAPAVEVVDTTPGAGDCFCGTLAATLARGATLQAATMDAIRAASLAVTRQGAAPAMPYRHELRE